MENEETLDKSVDEILADESTENETPKNEEEATAPEKVEAEKLEKSIDVSSLMAQKEHWRKKAEKLEKEKGSSKPSMGGTNPMVMVKLAKALEGYSEDEVDFITRNSDESIEGIINATKDKWVKTAIEANRKEEKEKNKVPGSSSSGLSAQQKNWKDIQKMSKEQFREYAEKQEKGDSGM